VAGSRLNRVLVHRIGRQGWAISEKEKRGTHVIKFRYQSMLILIEQFSQLLEC
jgi:hypothetical protein